MTETWRHLRAALIAFHALAVVVLSIPAPPPGLRGGGTNPQTEAAIARWSAAAARIGVPAATFEGAVRSVTGAQGTVLPRLQRPFRPYADLVGAKQSWLMFGTVPDRVALLELEVRTDHGWEPLYFARSDDADWRRELFDQERMRTFLHAVGRKPSRRSWEPFVDWVAREVGRERPDVHAVRASMRRVRIPPPEVLARTGALDMGETYGTTERAVSE